MTTEVFMICDAYESGMGKGLDGSKHKTSPFEKGSDLEEAYTIGYELGDRRRRERESRDNEKNI